MIGSSGSGFRCPAVSRKKIKRPPVRPNSTLRAKSIDPHLNNCVESSQPFPTAAGSCLLPPGAIRLQKKNADQEDQTEIDRWHKWGWVEVDWLHSQPASHEGQTGLQDC